MFLGRLQRPLLHAGYSPGEPGTGSPCGRESEWERVVRRRVQGEEGEGTEEVLPQLQEAPGQDRTRPDSSALHPHDQRQTQDTQPCVERKVQIVSVQ